MENRSIFQFIRSFVSRNALRSFPGLEPATPLHRRMSSRDDLYAVLGVHPKASLAEIKESYRRLALECHPDKLPAGAACGDESEDENARFRRVQEAWRILSDFQSRTTYDAQRVGTCSLLLTSTLLSTHRSPQPDRQENCRWGRRWIWTTWRLMSAVAHTRILVAVAIATRYVRLALVPCPLASSGCV